MVNLLKFWKKANCFNFMREFSYVHGLIKSPAPPRVFEIETTTNCPSQCLSCPKTYIFERKSSLMPLSLFKSIIEQIKPENQISSNNGKPSINLTHYGDISLYPYFPEAVEICKKQGLYVTASTNAALMTPELGRKIVKAGIDEIWMVIDGMDDETSMRIRGVSAKKGIANIHALIDIKNELGANSLEIKVIMIRQPANRHQWDKFLEYWNKVKGVSPYLGKFSSFGGDVPEINKLLKELQQMGAQPEEDNRIRYFNKFKCYYPWHSVSIQSDGLVLPCCRDMNGIMILGDLKEKSLAEIWNDKPIQELRRELNSGNIKNPLCSRCREANNEIGLPNNFYPGFRIINALFPGYRFNGKYYLNRLHTKMI